MFDFQRLNEPERVIAMARIGQAPDADAAARALEIVLQARAHLREHNRSDFDLEHPQIVLEALAQGSRVRPSDCVISVRSLDCRMRDEQEVTIEQLVLPCKPRLSALPPPERLAVKSY